MDPKEYIENLNELDQEENLLRRKYKIDFQLGDYYDGLLKLIELFKLKQGKMCYFLTDLKKKFSGRYWIWFSGRICSKI